MNKNLTQKSRFRSTTFIIEDTGLLVKSQTQHSNTEFHFGFEHIKLNRTVIANHNKGLLVIGGIFAGVAALNFLLSFSDKTVAPIGALLFLSVSIVLFIIYALTKGKKLYLQTTENQSIVFEFRKAESERVNQFVEQLITERNLYLSSKYGAINRNLEYGLQLNNLNWLLNIRAVSKAQHDEKIQELNTLFNSHLTNKPIGFTSKT